VTGTVIVKIYVERMMDDDIGIFATSFTNSTAASSRVHDQSGKPLGAILVSALGKSREVFLCRCCKGPPHSGAGVLSQKQVGKQPGPVPTEWIDSGHKVGDSNFPFCLRGPAGWQNLPSARQVGSDAGASYVRPIKTYDSSAHRGRRANAVECNSDTSYSLLRTTGARD
jgi:hypothetical protein